MKLCVICSAPEKDLALPLCAHSVGGSPLLAAWSVWVSPKHALSLHTSHSFCQMICPYQASEHFQCALENGPWSHSRCQDAHWFSQPYVCLSPIAPSICSGSDANPCVSAGDSVWGYIYVCVYPWLRVYIYFFLISTEEYNTSIQEKLPLIIGSAAAGLVFLIAVVVIIIVCNRWVNPAPVFIKLARWTCLLVVCLFCQVEWGLFIW